MFFLPFASIGKVICITTITGWPGIPYQRDHGDNYSKTSNEQGEDIIIRVLCEWGTLAPCPTCKPTVIVNDGVYTEASINQYVTNKIAQGYNTGQENYNNDTAVELS